MEREREREQRRRGWGERERESGTPGRRVNTLVSLSGHAFGEEEEEEERVNMYGGDIINPKSDTRSSACQLCGVVNIQQ